MQPPKLIIRLTVKFLITFRVRSLNIYVRLILNYVYLHVGNINNGQWLKNSASADYLKDTNNDIEVLMLDCCTCVLNLHHRFCFSGYLNLKGRPIINALKNNPLKKFGSKFCSTSSIKSGSMLLDTRGYHFWYRFSSLIFFYCFKIPTRIHFCCYTWGGSKNILFIFSLRAQIVAYKKWNLL